MGASCAFAQPCVVSPETRTDSIVTFRLYAPNARQVKVESDVLVPHQKDDSPFGGHTRQRKMHKDSAGVWSLTTEPVMPEVYQYRFVVDGKKIEDPLNPDSTYVLLHKESVVAVGGNPLADLYVEPDEGVARGRVDTIFVYCPEQNVSRKVLVYVPPVEQDSFPVLYLMHGISGDEATWIECGRVRQIMDNLLAHGRVKPMIVVMPDCNVPNKLEPKKRTNMLRNIFNFPQLRMGAFEAAFVHMHKSICERYPISSLQKDHYVAGLSSGAMQAANIARDQPELFGKVGLFSPARMKEEQFRSNKEGKEACVPCAESQPVYFVCIGTKDYFYQDGKRFIRRLANAGLTCTVYETESGHTWRSWREYLTAFIESL
ncbi:MAG: hypothetical protein J5635_04055 [Paludibacteraceae bacterium]|nr:hypothetical protein [Paludibacteraceae bacterium]